MKLEAAKTGNDPTKLEARTHTAASSSASPGVPASSLAGREFGDPGTWEDDKYMCWGECRGKCNFCKEFAAALRLELLAPPAKKNRST